MSGREGRDARLVLNLLQSALSERLAMARRYEALRDRAAMLCVTGGIGLAVLLALRTERAGTTVFLAVSVLILLSGLLGAVVALKYQERTEAQQAVARALRARIELIARVELGFDLGALVVEAEAAHRDRNPLHRLELHRVWLGAGLAVATVGLGLIAARLHSPTGVN
ncbi:MAG TPA: hypothetical protein VE684_11170 [Crenalkalicoccus sp.]|nr:hypothetical protein [Crenalkalicoccus sp.]